MHTRTHRSTDGLSNWLKDQMGLSQSYIYMSSIVHYCYGCRQQSNNTPQTTLVSSYAHISPVLAGNKEKPIEKAIKQKNKQELQGRKGYTNKTKAIFGDDSKHQSEELL